jgi:hypothetical protein
MSATLCSHLTAPFGHSVTTTSTAKFSKLYSAFSPWQKHRDVFKPSIP